MTVENIRKCMETNIGRKVRITTKEGRKNFVVRRGVIEQTYPSVFVVNFEGRDENCEKNRISFRYTDLLTHSIEMTVFSPTA